LISQKYPKSNGTEEEYDSDKDNLKQGYAKKGYVSYYMLINKVKRKRNGSS